MNRLRVALAGLLLVGAVLLLASGRPGTRQPHPPGDGDLKGIDRHGTPAPSPSGQPDRAMRKSVRRLRGPSPDSRVAVVTALSLDHGFVVVELSRGTIQPGELGVLWRRSQRVGGFSLAHNYPKQQAVLDPVGEMLANLAEVRVGDRVYFPPPGSAE